MKNISVILASVLAAGASSVLPVSADTTPQAASQVCMSNLTFPSAPATALDNFPVLVRISTAAPDGFSYDVCSDASHLWFTDDSGASLPFEVDTWDTNGTSFVWVSVPSLSSSATITMYWASDAAIVPDDIPSSSQVWTRAGYNAVWHFSGSAAESVNGLAATANGTPSYNGNASYPGPLGKTLWLDGSSYLSVANDPGWATVGAGSTLTISCWARSTRTDKPGCDRMISSMSNWKDTSGYELTIQNSVKVITVGSSSADGTGSQFQTTISTGVNAKWQHFAATYTATTTSLYVDGAAKNSSALNPVVSPVAKLAIGAGANAGSPWAGGLDEVRIRAAASTAAWIAEEHATVTNEAYISCSAAMIDPLAIATPVVTRGANGTFTVAAEVFANAPASIVCIAGGNITNAMATSDSELPMTYSVALAGLAADTTYVCAVEATSTGGTVVNKPCPTAFYNGDIAIEKIADAKEYCLVPGAFRISRADTAHDLVVNLSIGGTATPGQSYEAIPASVTIPDGADHVDVPLTPLADEETTDDVTVVVSLAAGNYGVPSASSATLTVVNIRPVKKTDYEKSMAFNPSSAALERIGAAQLRNFPVLVRLPAEVSAQMKTEDGTDLFFEDETCTPLSYEVEAFDKSGTALVWVKVPSLSSATRLTATFRGLPNLDNVPSDVWSDYAGVWHLDDAAGRTADSTANANNGTDRANVASVSDGAVGKAKHTSNANGQSDDNKAGVRIAQSASLNVAPALTMSMWYRPTASVSGSWAYLFAAKNSDSGASWGAQWRSDKIAVAPGGSTENTAIAPPFDAPTTVNAWTKLDVTISGNSISVYTNGALSATKTSTSSLSNGSGLALGSMLDNGYGAFVGDIDETRLRGSVVDATWAAVDYQNQSAATLFDAGAVEDMDSTAQVFKTPTVVRNANGTYTVTIELEKNEGDVGVIYDCIMANITNVVASAASPGVYSDTPSNLTADKTYRYSGYGKNANGTEIVEKGGVFYNGEISIVKVSNANEDGLVPGIFRISRADTAHDLTVAYTVGGTAVSDQTYAALSSTATIPAGSNSVDIVVMPLIDTQTTIDTTVTVTLGAGLYGIDAQAGSAELTVENLATPAGYNTWISPSNSLASIDCNWSAGHAPTAEENVLFDGSFSTKNCEWDSGASATVASWKQASDYIGTVMFDTEFSDYSGVTFPLFTITGNCDILGGKWSCRGNYNNFGATVDPMNTTATAKRWCLNVSVGGAMTIASGASVTVTGRGYGYPSSNTGVPAYGGYAYGGTSAPYGSITEPFDPGKGALAQGDQRRKISAIGGGAVKLAVAGNLTLDGSIVALGTADQNIARSGGSGGSIWIAANQISGSGTIDASAPTGIGNDQIVAVGSGGRIALYTQSLLEFPMANVSCNGTGYCGTYWAWNSRVGGPGTIYVKDPTQSHGTLYVKQSTAVSTQNTKWTGTPVMGDLTLDAVVLSGRTFLRIPEGASLTLPSLAAVTTDNTEGGQAGIVYAGGTLNIGDGNQTLKANVAFSSPVAFSFPGDLTLETGAKLGSLNSMYGTAANDYDQTFTVSVAGNLTIPAGASAGATRCCALTASGKARYAASHGGQSLYLAAEARTNGFDSVLNPSMPGGSANCNFPAGGAFTLTVGGTLTLDGPMTADGGGARGSDSTYDGTSAGAGGTLNITAGALAGGGKMSAEGGCGRSNYAGGAGGGRVAVRLTGNGSTFSDYWKTNITAYGVSFSAGKNEKASSAGTVYLQEKSDGEAAGTVLIRGDYALQRGATNNTCRTLYPGNGDGCDALEALKKTNLAIAGAAKVQLTDTFKIAGLSIENDSLLDLNGKTLTVNTAKVGGTKLEIGTYTASHAAVTGFVVDTADGAGGSLVVAGGGLFILVR